MEEMRRRKQMERLVSVDQLFSEAPAQAESAGDERASAGDEGSAEAGDDGDAGAGADAVGGAGGAWDEYEEF